SNFDSANFTNPIQRSQLTKAVIRLYFTSHVESVTQPMKISVMHTGAIELAVSSNLANLFI
ncbi:hypothetical protein DUE03_22575, partial [Salmonella enterica subsp. enterica serovar Kiambu]|nr:hypothetical protein [Salmonella enterica subsp. enterica serovar Kiambu]